MSKNEVQGGGEKHLSPVLLFAAFFIIILIQTCVTLGSSIGIGKKNREFQQSKKMQYGLSNKLTADLETIPVATNRPNDDAADDPAIWYNAEDPTRTIIFGSNKKGGIHAYDLSGQEVQYVPCGRINNIDIRKEVKLGDQMVDVLVGSNRSENTIDIFIIAPNGRINKKVDYSITLGDFEPYGLCLYKSEAASLFVFVNNKQGAVHQIAIDLDRDNKLIASTLRKLKLATQVEGMVVDDNSHLIYIGEEEAGIHVFSAWPASDTTGHLLAGSSNLNENIKFDIEGLALLPPHYLLASSQGNFSYAIFDLEKQKYHTSFAIKDGNIDGVEETDGLEIMAKGLGAKFPNGLLVVQDGYNYDGDKKKNQNFKVIELGKLTPLIE